MATLINILWPALILFLIFRGQFREKDIPTSLTAPIVIGAAGILVIYLNSWWFTLTPVVVAYLLVSVLIGIVFGTLRGRVANVYWSPTLNAPARRGGVATCVLFAAGMALHYGAEFVFALWAPVLYFGGALTINLYLAASIGAAGVEYRKRAGELRGFPTPDGARS